MASRIPLPSGPASGEPRPNQKVGPTMTSAVKHLILVGACYMDTILTVPFFPEEDSKLRATGLQVRRGGNCPNTLEVFQQLLSSPPYLEGGRSESPVRPVPYLVSPLPDREALATKKILDSFGKQSDDSKGGGSHDARKSRSVINFDHCLYRDGHQEPASSYIIRNAATQSRTIVNYNDLAEMTTDEFVGIANTFAEQPDGSGQESWWHFEGRIPTTTLQCIRYLRQVLPRSRISVEVEKPNREGLDRLAAEADVVFYSRTWAENRGYAGPEACLTGQATSPGPSLMLCTWGEHGASGLFRSGEGEWEYMQYRAKLSEGSISVVDTIGAGDTFIAGMLFGLVCHAHDWSQQERLAFATELATRKVQIDGFVGLLAG
ncbi:Ketohexokinase [Naviculisporaceae sp. PSN 640]